MKSIFTILIVSLFSVVKSQTVILNESFENYQDFSINNFGNWICLDLDQLDTWTLGGDPAPPSNWFATWPNAGAKMAFQIFNPSQSNASNDATGITGEIRNFDPHTGNKYAGSWAGKMVSSGNGNKDWLISPVIKLSSSGNELSLWLKTLSASYGDERYRIGIYVGNGIPSSSNDFNIISGNTSPSETYLYAYSYWKKDIYNLDAYAGQNIRIGVFCMTQEGSMLMVDDVKITTTGNILSVNESQKNSPSIIYPNPTYGEINIINQKNLENIEIYNISGQKLKTIKTKNFDISDLAKGVYYIKIISDEKNSETFKVIKE